MLSAIRLLLRQIAANSWGASARRCCRALIVEQFESRNLLASVTLTPVADNTMFQDQTSHADGAGPTMFSGETARGLGARRALVKFDVAGNIPAGAHIDSVTLQLHIFKDRGSSNDVELHRLEASWGEGASNSGATGGDGVNALANDATWSVRFTGANPAQPWSTPGGDFNPTASAVTQAGTGLGTSFFQWTSAQLATDVQNWLNSPSTQFGWMIMGDESVPGSAIAFDSRESTTPGNRPMLTINYTLIGNQPPTLNTINDPLVISEDAGQQAMNLSGISAGPGETQNLTVTVTSSNPGLIPTPTVNYTSPNSTGSLTYTPVANQSGSSVITVKVQDDGGTANGGIDTVTRSFTVQINPVNDAPTLNTISSPSILEDADQQTINLTGISAGPSETQTLTVTAVSDNPGLIPNPTVNYNSPNSTGSLTYTPVANQSGSAKITVTVKDNGGTTNNGVDTVTRTFTVSVTPVNDPPTLDPIPDPQAILQDAGQQTINLTGISAGPLESQTLSVSASSSNTGLIPNPTVIYTTPNPSGSLKYTPVSGHTGTATITVTVRDAGMDGEFSTPDDAAITHTFLVQVIPPDAVNHAPSFEKGSDQSATDEDPAVSITAWASSISAGPPNEASQSLNFIVVTDNDALFAVKPAVDPSGKLTFTPAPNAHGLAHVSLRLHDNGGTANGGVDTSDAQTFDLTITKPHPWHNTAKPLDVTGDTFVAANDALAIINYINAFHSTPVPPNAPFGPSYFDPNNDGFVAANDALAVINFINANLGGGGEPVAAVNAQAADSLMQQLDALLLLGSDGIGQSRRRA